MAVERKWNGTEWVVTGGGGDVAVGAVGMRATVEIDSAPPIGTTWTTVPTTNIVEDHGGAFSLAANGVMTCLIAGVYSVSAGVFWARTTDADLRANLYLNGGSIGKGLGSVSTNKYMSITMTATVSLDVGDEIWLSALANPASSLLSNINDYQGSYLEAFSVAGLKGDKGDKGDQGDPWPADSHVVYEARGSASTNTLPIGTFSTSLEIPGARISMPVKAGDVVFYTFNGWLSGGTAAGDARLGCEPSGVAYTKVTGWTSAQAYIRQPPGVYAQQSLTDWLTVTEDGTLILQLRGYGVSGATTPQANYVGIKAWIPKGQQGDKGDKGDTGDKGDPGLMGDLPTTRVSTSTWHITNNTTDYMPISTVERDDRGWVSGDEIIVDADGAYLVSGSVAKTTNNMVRSTLAVAVNGGGTDVGVDQQWAAGGTFRRRSVSGVLLLNAGDRVALRALLNSGSDVADAAGSLSVTKLEGMQGPKGDPGLVNGIQSGVVTCVGTGAATADGVVTFPQPYASTPVIVCTPAANSYASATTAGLSATGFTARIRRVDDGGSFGGNTDVHWMAMGTLA